MNAKGKAISDQTLKMFLWRWLSAISAQAERIKTGHEKGSLEADNFDSGRGNGWSDSVLLLEAMSQFYRWYDHAIKHWPQIAANTTFRHEAITLALDDSVLVMGGRLALLDAADQLVEIGNTLRIEGFLKQP